jgi:hypothetical protein
MRAIWGAHSSAPLAPASPLLLPLSSPSDQVGCAPPTFLPDPSASCTTTIYLKLLGLDVHIHTQQYATSSILVESGGREENF